MVGPMLFSAMFTHSYASHHKDNLRKLSINPTNIAYRPIHPTVFYAGDLCSLVEAIIVRVVTIQLL